MDNLKAGKLLFALADTGFLAGFLKGVGAPINAEGWGLAAGGLLFYLASQLLQGKLTARRMRALRRELATEIIRELQANKTPAINAVPTS